MLFQSVSFVLEFFSPQENSEAGFSGAPPLLGILFEVVSASDLMMHFQICALQKHVGLSNTFASVAITQRRSCFYNFGEDKCGFFFFFKKAA